MMRIYSEKYQKQTTSVMKKTISSLFLPKARFYTSFFLPLLFLLLSSTSCYHYRVVSTGNPDDLVAHKKTQVDYLWGIVQAQDITADCDGIYEVQVTTNVGYILLSVVTLGTVVPQKVEWKCAIENLPIDTIP